MDKVKNIILADAIREYMNAEIKIKKQKIAIIGLGISCIILIAIIIMLI